MDDRKALTLKEAAARLSISPRTLWTLAHVDGVIAYARIGRRVVYPVASLDSFLAKQTVTVG